VRFDVIKAIDAENSSLMWCDVMWCDVMWCDVMLCHWASVSCKCVLLWLLEPEKNEGTVIPPKTSGTTHSVIQNHIPEDFT